MLTTCPLHFVRIAAERTSPVLVFLHHGLGSVSQWKQFPERIAKATGCPAVVYDRQGHGQSPRLAGPRTVRYLYEGAVELAGFLETLSISDVILIGHSDGGSIALLYPAASGRQPRGIITEAAHLFVEDCTRSGIRDVVAAWPHGLRERLARHHGEKTEDLFRNWSGVWLSPEFDSFCIARELEAIRCPVLALQGAEDEFGTEAQLNALQLAGAKTLLLENCRHEPHHESPEATASAMIDFIHLNSTIVKEC